MAYGFRSGLAVLLCSGTLSAGAAPLKFCFEDVPQPPWTMPDKTGLSFNLLAKVEKTTGEQFKTTARPWRRCIEELRLGLVDGIIAAGDSTERRGFARFPQTAEGNLNVDAAIYIDRAYVFMQPGAHASWDGKELYSEGKAVIAQHGYLVGDMLRERGYDVQGVKSPDEGLRMLLAGMADVAVLQGLAATDLAKRDPRFRGKITQSKQLYMQLPVYLMVSHKTYEANPKRIETIWSAIAAVRASADYRAQEQGATRRMEAD
jgi:polar amino acid transport system substrate-binding protein